MTDRTKGNETNDDTNLQAETLIDLPVSEAQADETKGGPGHAGEIELLSWSIGVASPAPRGNR